MYTNTQNGQQQVNNDDSYWESPRRVQLTRFTKVKTGKDGQSQRGAYITDEQGASRWVSEHPNNQVFKMDWGNWIYFNGIGARPSLTVNQPEQQPPSMNQANADYYSRKAKPHYEQALNVGMNGGQGIEQSNVRQDIEPYYFSEDSQNGQPSKADVDDRLVERLSVTMSNCVNMSMSLNPQLPIEEQTKLAISVFIQYSKIKSDNPF